MKLVRLAGVLFFGSIGLANAQSWDSSGNNLLSGTYYFRETAYVLQDVYGDFNDVTTIYGNITFDGKGNYTISGTALDYAQGYLGPYSYTGTYVIAASGYGYIASPLSGTTPIPIYGLVSQQGIFIGSATESYFDFLVAAPVGSTPATVGTLKGTYTIADIDFTQFDPTAIGNYLFQITPDGAGNLPATTVNGYISGYGSQMYPQTLASAKYTFQNGAGVLQFPTSQNAPFVYGQKYLYISPDGNFVFGGSPNAFDMFVGVRTATGTPSFSGLYYQAGMDEDASTLSAGYVTLDTYYGALNAITGSVIGHQRLEYNDPADNIIAVSGYTYSDTFTPNSGGVYANSVMRYTVGANGIRIGSGIGPELGINVALPAPNVTGQGVYIDPQYVVNAATFAPFTAGVSPGEFVTIAGQNLASSNFTATSLPFPNTLGNVQVTVNGLAAPVYVVTPTYISFLIPYAVTTSIASIQVISGGTASNTVTVPVNMTTPGVFTLPPGGLGGAAALHADYSLVNSAKPAQAGETISVFVTGLGAVNPMVQDGSAGPTNPLSTTTNTIAAYINGQAATVSYSGLAPELGGLYQVNLTVPTGLASGTYTVDIAGPDGYSSEATIAVGTATTSSSDILRTPQIAKRRLHGVPVHPLVIPRLK